MPSRILKRLALLAFALLLGLAGCGTLAVKERELTFRVEPGTSRWFGGMPAGIQEEMITVDSGTQTERLHIWWWPAERANAPAILYLHGARWNLTGHLFRIEQLRDFGYSVLAVDYRGFGRSDGKLPSEEMAYEDALAAWNRLAELQPDPQRRFIYGHSLGGAVAIDLAERLSRQEGEPAARGLIVEAAFTTLGDMARSLSLRWLPVELILTQKFDSIDKIKRVRVPVLFVHGTNDRIVTPRFSERLHAAAPGVKRLLMIEGGTHNNSMRIGSEAYRAALAEMFGASTLAGLAPSESADASPRLRSARLLAGSAGAAERATPPPQ